ncbi:MAG: PKD domain-containing protein [Crocinitomicaceae bacterium]|nr:PKD domain-containing protein [Crocinitomicaceae bacterium]
MRFILYPLALFFSINIIAQPCQSSFYWYQDSSTTQTVIAINNSTTTSAATYMWDFGDGNTSSLAYPTHQYSQLGTYHVCLTIMDIDTSNNGGTCTSFFCDSVFVTFKMSGFSFNVYPESVLQNTEETLDKFSIYPNPSGGILNLKLPFLNGEKEITIASIDGKVAQQFMANKKEIKLDLSPIKPGAYFIQIDGYLTKQIFIE